MLFRSLHMATYLLNILPSKLLGHVSPLEILYARQPSYSHLRVFGCLCYPLFPSTTINKLQPRSTPCVFLGYPPNHRGYKCYDMSSRKIFVSRHVLFDETQFPFSTLNTKPDSTSYHFLDDDSTNLLPFLSQQPTRQPAPTLLPERAAIPAAGEGAAGNPSTASPPASPAHCAAGSNSSASPPTPQASPHGSPLPSTTPPNSPPPRMVT